MSDKQKTQEDLMSDTFGDHRREDLEEEQETSEHEEREEEETEESSETEEQEAQEEETEEQEESKEEETEVSAEEELESILEPQVEVSEEQEEEEETGTQEDEEEKSESAFFELSDEDFEEVTTSREALKNYAQKIHEKTLESARQEYQQEIAKAKEEILQNIPDVVGKANQRIQTVRSLTQNFYQENPVLKEKRPYVKNMTAAVSSEHPDWSPKQVLDEVATRAKRDLDISATAEKREQERKPNPRFAGAGGRRAPSGQVDNRSNQEKLLDDTFSGN